MMVADRESAEESTSNHYNEVVVDAVPWVQNMPYTILAFFVSQTGVSLAVQEKSIAESQAVRRDFQKMYRLRDDQLPPLVTYRTSARPAFVLAQ